MSYPIKVHQQSLDHHNGTKSYHLVVIEAADGKSLFINRWGKKGQFGQFQVRHHPDAKSAWKNFEKWEVERAKKGYSPAAAARIEEARTPAELSKAVGIGLFNKMGAEAVNHIDPGYDTTGMQRTAALVEYDEETGRKIDVSRKADITELLEKQRAEERSAYAANEDFGMF